jgi:hypothetical protein
MTRPEPPEFPSAILHSKTSSRFSSSLSTGCHTSLLHDRLHLTALRKTRLRTYTPRRNHSALFSMKCSCVGMEKTHIYNEFIVAVIVMLSEAIILFAIE